MEKPDLYNNRFTGFSSQTARPRKISPELLAAYDALMILMEKEGSDEVERLTALIVEHSRTEIIEKQYGQEVKGRKQKTCAHELTGQKCPHRTREMGTWNCPDNLTGDHLVYREKAFTYEPYSLTEDGMRKLVRLCDTYNLQVNVRAKLAAHAPGDSIHIALYPKESRKE